MYVIIKTFQGLGVRYLSGAEQPYQWVKDVASAMRTHYPSDFTRNIKDSEAVEAD